MPKDSKQAAGQEIGKRRVRNRKLVREPVAMPDIGFSEEDEAIVWDDDQRQLIENQDMTEIEKSREK